MTDTAEVTEELRPLVIGASKLPVRIMGGNIEAHYFVVSCDHGTTEYHDPTQSDVEAVKTNLVAKHNEELGCTCRPA